MQSSNRNYNHLVILSGWTCSINDLYHHNHGATATVLHSSEVQPTLSGEQENINGIKYYGQACIAHLPKSGRPE